MAEPLYCSSCGTQIGVTPNRLRGYLYCSELCPVIAPPLGRNEERDSLVVAFARCGMNHREIGEAFGLTRQRVQQIVDSAVPAAA